MGKLSEGINGPVSGTVGGLVFYQVGKQTRVRSLPRRNKKKRKPTPLQALQREKFAVMQRWMKPMKGIFRIGFGDPDSPRSGHNAAMSYNMNHAIVYNEEKYEVNPQAFKFSHGPLSPPVNVSARQTDGGLRFTWEQPADQLSGWIRTILLVHNPDPERGNSWLRIYGADASKREDTLDLRTFGFHTGDTCHAYMAFIKQDDGQVSDSVYAGAIVMEKTDVTAASPSG
ncbi:DUF6266 family protein [Parapedobacter sp. DT-150]|uniref:DUF6266 family protein n=1 Tax=Parapedobacter sp. DT-150 TaxID=3396162 RepID=UPI003F1A3B1F